MRHISSDTRPLDENERHDMHKAITLLAADGAPCAEYDDWTDDAEAHAERIGGILVGLTQADGSEHVEVVYNPDCSMEIFLLDCCDFEYRDNRGAPCYLSYTASGQMVTVELDGDDVYVCRATSNGVVLWQTRMSGAPVHVVRQVIRWALAAQS